MSHSDVILSWIKTPPSSPRFNFCEPCSICGFSEPLNDDWNGYKKCVCDFLICNLCECGVCNTSACKK